MISIYVLKMKKIILMSVILLFLTSCVQSENNVQKENTNCDQLNDSGQKIDCKKEIAVQLKDVSLCPGIGEDIDCRWDSSSPNPQCIIRRECIINIAKISNDYTVCEYISEDNKDGCYYPIALQLKDKEKCSTLGSGTAELCFQQLSPWLDGEELCGEITNLEAKDNCYFGLANDNEDPSFCRLIDDSESKSSCLKYSAGRLKDTKLCEETLDPDSCFVHMAKFNSNMDYCTHSSNRINCYSSVGYQAGCGIIINPTFKEECREFFDSE